MKIQDRTKTDVYNETKLLLETINLRNAKVLELGCGKADKTKALSNTGLAAEILALEVDERQLQKNLALPKIPGVTFSHGGAESIPAADNTFDVVMLFKSFHHVPLELMDKALEEIHRVLKPGGYVWLSEPVFDGDFNEVMRMFHDEERVREAAFRAVKNSVDNGLFSLSQQIFFLVRNHFDNFEDFDNRMIKVTHSDHQLAPDLHKSVREKFESFLSDDGANFLTPQRVDLLVKPITHLDSAKDVCRVFGV